jgi:hypothetical protein
MKKIILIIITIIFSCGISNSEPDGNRAGGKNNVQANNSFVRLLEKYQGNNWWYGVYIRKNKVGYANITFSLDKSSKKTNYKIMLSLTAKMKAMGITAELKIVQYEKFNAHPPYELKFHSLRTQMGESISKVTIFKTSEGYLAKIFQGNDVRKQTIGPLDYTLKHMFAVETWIQKKPKVGESIKYIEFDTNKLKMREKTAYIKTIHNAVVEGVKIKYYEIITTDPEGIKIEGTYGADGTVYTMNFGKLLELRLEPKKLAMKLDKPVDLFVTNIVKINQTIGESKKVVQLKLAIDNASGALIGNASGQTVEKDIVNGRYIITLNPYGSHYIKASDKEIKKNLESTVRIPARHPKVIALAKKAVGGAKTTKQKVARLVKFVNEYIKDDYNADSLTLLDIIARREGDCSEHSILFTALARSQGIPCREVTGLGYMGDKSKGFGGHAWNEVVIDGRWVPVDATWGQTTIDPFHIRFPISKNKNLEIMTIIPKMKLSVLDVQLKKH